MRDREQIDAVRRNRDEFDTALAALGCRIKGKSASCPWHDDQNPSASILESADGAWRLHCHVCDRSGDVFDLREQAGGSSVASQIRALSADDAKPMRTPTQPTRARVFRDLAAISVVLAGIGRVDATYEYAHPETRAVELAIFRIMPADGKKTFRQASPTDGGWILEAPPKPWPLYNRARVLAAGRVVVVEGEKCVHALHSLGIVATTSPCGAGKAEHADWSALTGKDVILWPDHDETGAKHMSDVRRILEGLPTPPRLSIVDPKGLSLAPKGDAADLSATLGTDTAQARLAIASVLEDARPLGASGDVGRLIEDTIAGRRKAIPWPWPRLSALSRSLLPGTVTVLCGDPGCGKSFMLLEAAAAWHHQGEHVALLEIEEDRAYHLHRVLAQQAQNGRIFDDAWTAEHPAEVRDAFAKHSRFLDDFGRRVFDCPKPPSMDEIATWIEGRAAAGARLIIVDPVTAAATSDRPWDDDLRIMLRAKSAAKASGASVVLAIHPKKGTRGKSLGLDDMAGGAAYQRFAQSVLWLEAFPEPKTVSINGLSADINRSVAILKSRNGPGHGARIGFNFEGHSLRFAERGMIEKKLSPEAAVRARILAQARIAADPADASRAHHNHAPRPSEDAWGDHVGSNAGDIGAIP